MSKYFDGIKEGFFGSLNNMVKMDIQRNMDRMSRVEQYQTTRRMQLLDRAETEGKDLKDDLRELAALTGSNRRAAMAAEGVGGTAKAIKELVVDLKAQRKKLGKGFKIDKFVDFAGEDTLKDPRTLADNFRRFRPDINFDVNIPEGMTKSTGIMAKLGIPMRRDITADVESTIPIGEEYTSPRDTSVIPSATIDFSEGYEAKEFALKFAKNKDETFKTTENILAYGQELMLKNPDKNSPEYKQGKTYFDMAMNTLAEKKKKENPDTETELNPKTALSIASHFKNTIYDVEHSETIGETLEAKLVGTNSYISYFEAQPFVIDAIEEAKNTYNNDKTLALQLRTEKKEYARHIDNYMSKFKMQEIPQNKGVLFKDESVENGGTRRVFAGYAPAVNINTAIEKARKGEYSIGDIVNIEQDGNQVLAVWTGKEWDN